MTEPRNDPPPAGSDSVQDLHRPHMDVMNDPVMLTADGVILEDEEDRALVPDHADSVQALHDVFMREHAEPRDGFEPVPFWVAVVCGGLLLWGGYYIGSGTADFRRDVFDRSDLRPLQQRAGEVKEPDPQTVSDLMKIGAQVYGSRCVSCHGPDGMGRQGADRVPPLAGSEWVVGAEAGPARQGRIVLYGIQGDITVNGQKYTGNMPPWGALRDYELASVLTFVRNSWGNRADPEDNRPAVTTMMIAATRAKEGPKRVPLSEAELKSIPVDQVDAAPAAKKDEGKK
jgi:mono/diheme cytochrome c family protein